MSRASLVTGWYERFQIRGYGNRKNLFFFFVPQQHLQMEVGKTSLFSLTAPVRLYVSRSSQSPFLPRSLWAGYPALVLHILISAILPKQAFPCPIKTLLLFTTAPCLLVTIFAHFRFLGKSVSTPDCCFIYQYIFSPQDQHSKRNMHSINTWMDEQMNDKNLSKSGIKGFQRIIFCYFYFGT